ncbi:MAG: nucleotidyltransferase domain-containing protein [Planctomycetes bacterium]|nr:nucleotidyltransferase domain-containing protein [Planctomycetota bacterium]
MGALETTLGRCRQALAKHYGGRLRGIVLYGSSARGDAAPESDVDLLVLLEGPVDSVAEARHLTDLLYPIQLDSDRYLSAKAASADDYAQGRLQLYRNVQREGVPV